MTNYTLIDHCLACDSTDLTLKLDLTDQALANNYLKSPDDPEASFPLAVNLCRSCHHLQLTHAVDPEIIYRHYLYVSGTSKTAHQYFDWFARFARETAPNWPTSVLDIGCNDGTQLDYFKSLGMSTFGIDPAENLYPTSSKNHKIYCDFFNEELVDRLLKDGLYPDIIVAQNSFAHNPTPHEYLVNLKKIMKPTSLFFIQTSQAEMIQHNEFDTIYHEHINFFNINSMDQLCKRAGLNLIDVVKSPIHGTSYIFIISPYALKPMRTKNLIAMEESQGLLSETTYDQWRTTVQSNISQLIKVVNDGRQSGYKLIGYGAAAKGNTLLNFSKIKLDFIIDDNPIKQGLYTPGMHIPIVGIEHLDNYTDKDKIMFIPLAWNFYKEIRNKILTKRTVASDKFIKYFPNVEVET